MIRKAILEDADIIHSLLQTYNNKGKLLPRPLSNIYDHLRDFWIFEDTGKNRPVGCCALQFCWRDLAEIRSLAVESGYTGQGIGTFLVERAIQEAFFFKIKNLFVLTYKPEFFKKFGFVNIDKKELPIKVWSDCIGCVSFPNCDETAMLKTL